MQWSGMHGGERQARLRPQHAHLYPGIAPNEWLPAWAMAERLLALAEARGVPPHHRVCDPRHFQFRGGSRRDPRLQDLRTRGSDVPSR
jgi:hypothetical protein